MFYDLKKDFSVNGVVYALKPCPFCGQFDQMELPTKKNFDELFNENGSATIKISCQGCGLALYEHDYRKNNFNIKFMILAEKWNNRNHSNIIDAVNEMKEGGKVDETAEDR